MSTTDSFPFRNPASAKIGEPVWDLALMFPRQGGWTVDGYLSLDGGLLVEFTNGFITVLSKPTMLHQWIVRLLFRKLDAFINAQQLGEVLTAPLPVELTSTTFREPDIVYLRSHRIRNWRGQPQGADLVVEVVSEGRESWQRDHVQKRGEYAAAGIAEYWIVDPQEQTFTVLTLSNDQYVEHAVFRRGETATSVLLGGFQCPLDEIFAKCDEAAG